MKPLRSAQGARRSDQELWLEFKGGSESAFEYIYRKYFNKIYNYGMTVCREESVVKEAIQQLFVDMWQSRMNLGDVSNVYSYLIKSLRNKLIEFIERDKKFDRHTPPENMEVEFIPSKEALMIENQEGELRSQRVRILINDLSPRQREAIMLIFFENKSYDEAAAILSMSVQAVYTLVWRAISSLKNKVNS